MSSKRGLIWGSLFALLLAVAAMAGPEGEPEDLVRQLKYRHIGPIGNRVSAVVGVPGDPNVYFVGAASGGIFKTTDAGAHWDPVFDGQPAASIGSLAIAPSDPNVIWVGTGETFIRSNVSIGNGVYRSTDGGATWTHLGLEKTGRIGRIVVDPRDPDVALVAAMGSCYGPQPERGVYRTADGGKTWEKTLFVDENTGASDLAIDPNNPRIVYAGMWPLQIWTWGRRSGGPGGGLWKSTDAGVTWQKLSGHGLPEPPLGKIGLTISAENSDRVYALIETNSNHEFAELKDHQGVLWRSDDGGENWAMVNGDHTLAQRPLYYTRALAAPDRSNEVYFLSTQFSRSLDAGKTYERMDAGGDNHDMWIDPKIPDRMIVGHDGGISITVNRGKTWFRPQLPVAQMYHAFTDDRVPYFVYGNRQDGGSYRGPSNNLSGGDIGIGEWRSVGGCESGFAVPDPVTGDVVWSGCYEGILERHDLRTGHTRNVSVWPDNPEAWPAKDIKYRFQWTFPIAISPHDHNKVYVGSQFVHQTTDGGNSWTVISPDLTGNDKERQQKTGGLTPDDAGPTIAPVVFAIAESPVKAGLIWAGTNDGRVHLTMDGGRTWNDLTANIPDLPPWGTISNVEPSRFDAAICYIAVDLHQVNDPNPYVYKTTDYGRTWTSIRSNLPLSVFGYAHCVREDPVRRGLLYLGTENAIYFSLNDGGEWIPLQSNLPHVPVYWLTVQERFSDLVVATYGRGFWILDDVTPLRQLDSEEPEADVRLFVPRDAYRLRSREGAVSQPDDPAAGENPPDGASIDYFLKEPVAEGLKLSILDSDGKVVREFKQEGKGSESLSGDSGINRLWWDLRYERSKEPKLRTKPLEHSHVDIGDKGFRPLREGRRFGPLAPPGVYHLKLVANGKEYVQNLTVLKDPTSEGSEEDIGKATAVARDLRDRINQSVEMINEVEQYRWQIESLHDLLKPHDGSKELLDEAESVAEALRDLEGEFFDLRLTNARQDTLRWPRRLYSKMTILASVVDQSDQAPTVQQMEVYSLYKDLLDQLAQRLEGLRGGAISSLNDHLRERKFPTLIGTSGQ